MSTMIGIKRMKNLTMSFGGMRPMGTIIKMWMAMNSSIVRREGNTVRMSKILMANPTTQTQQDKVRIVTKFLRERKMMMTL